MKYALIVNGVVDNIIALSRTNALDFSNAVDVSDRPVIVGDTYSDGVFTRDGAPVQTDAEHMTAMASALAEADAALLDAIYDNILGGLTDE